MNNNNKEYTLRKAVTIALEGGRRNIHFPPGMKMESGTLRPHHGLDAVFFFDLSGLNTIFFKF